MHYAKKKWMMKGITLALTGAMVLAGSGCSMEIEDTPVVNEVENQNENEIENL